MRASIVVWMVLSANGIAHAAPVSPAAHREAQQRLESGRKLFDQGDYTGAERELLIGQELEPLPVFNYTLGQVERRLGHCNRAIDYYREYLKTAEMQQRAYTVVQINRCKEELAQHGLTYHEGVDAPPPKAEPVPSPPPAPIVTAPSPPPVVVEAPARVAPKRPWFRDPAGWSLVGVGAGVAAAGAALTVLGNPSDVRSTYGALEDARDHRWMSPTGIALLCTGGVLVIAGSARLAWVARRAR